MAENFNISFENSLKELTKLLLEGFSNASDAHEYVFNDKEQFGVNFLSKARSFMLTAKLLYVLDSDLSHIEFEQIFEKFHTFDNELMDNFSTDHSHQWTDIEFRNLQKSFMDAADLLSVTPDYFE